MPRWTAVADNGGTFTVYEHLPYKIKPETSEEFLAEPLFYNQNIQIEKTTIFFREWSDKNIYTIGHLIDDAGTFYSYQQFIAKYEVTINMLTYYGCIQAIKQFAKKLNITFNNNITTSLSKSIKMVFSQQKGTKIYYNILTCDNKVPNCCSRWENVFQEVINWKKCFDRLRRIQEIKLRWFQIRILHRILATNVVLKEMGVAESNKCSQCNDEKDSILHGLWECQSSKTFWNDFLEFIHTHCANVNNLIINGKIIILGTDNTFKSDKAFDYILLCAKFYLHHL